MRDIEILFGDVDINDVDYNNQYQSKVILRVITNIMKAEEIKIKNFQ